ncbi:MAG: heme ABC transporter ATP-binding protein [Pseudomonadota bacterium]
MSIRLSNVSYSQGTACLLDGVTTSFTAGQVSAIVGPNGAGKTTLMRLISGEMQGSGEIFYHERNLRQLSLRAQAACRAVMTQSSQVVFDFSVEDILHMGWIQSDRLLLNETLSAVANRCGISSFLDRRFNSLSGGEQQRVQFARALLQLSPVAESNYPAFLLLDEPTASLDVAHEMMVLGLAKEAAAQGLGVVVILHDLNLASRFADNIYLMRDAQLIAAGPPEHILVADLLSEVYATPLMVEQHPQLQCRIVLAR